MLKIKQLFFYFIPPLIFSLLVCTAAAAAEKEPPPLATRIILNKAGQYITKNDLAGAIKVLEAFQARGKTIQDPGVVKKKGYNHYLIDFTLGNCYLSTNRPRAALDHYRAATGKSPSLSPAWLNLAKCYYDLGQYGEAARAFLHGYESADKKQAKTLYYSLVSFMAATEYSHAIEIIERLTRTPGAPIPLEWKERFVQTFMAAQKPRKALPYILELAEKSSGKKQKQWQETLLYQYISLEMNEKALAYLLQLTREDPTEKKWWKALANLHLSHGKYKKALTALMLYHYLTPLPPREKRLMADLNMMLGIPARAVPFYESLPDKEKNADMVRHLASGYLGLHQSDRALAAVEKGLQDTGDDILLMLKGRILYEMKEYKAAARVFETAALKKNHPGEAWLMLGYAAWNLTDTKRARHAFHQAAKFPAQQKNAKKMLAMLRKTRTKLNIEK
jgi:tetratricopeptide (TPR) repeat protein